MLMDQTQGTEMERLWNLLGELSSQLSHNRQQTEELHRRADELRSQAIHSQTGYTLKRFNIEISQEVFDSELEKLNVSLVLENQSLQQENRQLSSLLKDYESTLEIVMSKFRSFAHTSQQHDLELIRHYENLLLSSSSSTTTLQLLEGEGRGEETTIDLQSSLANLSSLIRKALRSLQGEDPEDCSSSPLLNPRGGGDLLLSSLSLEGKRELQEEEEEEGEESPSQTFRKHHQSNPFLDPSSGGYINPKTSTSNLLYIPTTSTSSLIEEEDHEEELEDSSSSSSSSTSQSSTSSTSSTSNSSSSNSTNLQQQPPSTTNRGKLSNQDQSEISQRRTRESSRISNLMKSKGLGPLDSALEREIELEALKKENWELKKLLGITDEDEDQDQHDQVELERGGQERQVEVIEEEEMGRRGGGGEKKKLFESGAEPEKLDDDDEDEDEDEDEEEKKERVELSKEDQDLFKEFFGEPTTNESPRDSRDRVEQEAEEKDSITPSNE